jgi:hypothetical protein
MISRHTPPGTKVVFLGVSSQTLEAARAKGRYTIPEQGAELTVREIYATPHASCGFGAYVDEVIAHGFCLTVLRRRDLPECLTSLLNTTPLPIDKETA